MTKVRAAVHAPHAPRPGLLRLAQAAIELQHIGNVLGDLVAGVVAAEDDVSHVGDRRRCSWKFSGEGAGDDGIWGIVGKPPYVGRATYARGD
jgi:hypothetical protein